MNIIGLLVTGPEENHRRFYLETCDYLARHIRRDNTAHYTCYEEHLSVATQAAKNHDMTLQRILHSIVPERKRTVPSIRKEYKVLHLGSHGMQFTGDGQ